MHSSSREEFEAWICTRFPGVSLDRPAGNCGSYSSSLAEWHWAGWQAARATTAWKAIDLAPKDGTYLLLNCPRAGVVRGRWKNEKDARKPRSYWTNDSEYIWGVRATLADQPTHFQPLPPPEIV